MSSVRLLAVQIHKMVYDKLATHKLVNPAANLLQMVA